jgi:uncharacterized protein YkwD
VLHGQEAPLSIEVASELEQRIAAAINGEREKAGLAPLKLEAHLNASAQGHSDWMAETGSLSHTGEDGSSVGDRIAETGLPLTGAARWSENLAYTSVEDGLGADEADRMHEGLMGSAGHRANILDPDVSYFGIGLSVGTIEGGGGREMAFLTQNFAATDGEVLVQEEVGGQTLLQPWQNGEPVGEPFPPDEDEDQPDDPDPDDAPADDGDDDNGDGERGHAGDGEVEDGGGPPDPDGRGDPDRDDDEDSGGGCFVATAAYGDRLHPDVVDLRRFRDEILVDHAAGRSFIRIYQLIGQRLARLVKPHRASGRAARAMLAPLARAARRAADRCRERRSRTSDR